MNIIKSLKALAIVGCFVACAIAFQSLKRSDDIWLDSGIGGEK